MVSTNFDQKQAKTQANHNQISPLSQAMQEEATPRV